MSSNIRRNSKTETRIEVEDAPDREPSHSGETLEDYIEYYGLEKKEVAETLDVSFDTISKICNGHRTNITTDMALRFAKLFGTSAQLWLNLSQRRKIWEERQEKNGEYDRIEEKVKKMNISGKRHWYVRGGLITMNQMTEDDFSKRCPNGCGDVNRSLHFVLCSLQFT